MEPLLDTHHRARRGRGSSGGCPAEGGRAGGSEGHETGHRSHTTARTKESESDLVLLSQAHSQPDRRRCLLHSAASTRRPRARQAADSPLNLHESQKRARGARRRQLRARRLQSARAESMESSASAPSPLSCRLSSWMGHRVTLSASATADTPSAPSPLPYRISS